MPSSRHSGSNASGSSSRHSRSGSRYDYEDDRASIASRRSSGGRYPDEDLPTYTRSVASAGSGHFRSSPHHSTSSGSRAAASHGTVLPRIIEVDDSEAWNSSDEEYVLSQWEARKPTSSFGTPYGSRPSSDHHSLDARSHRDDRSNACSRASHSSSHRDNRSQTGRHTSNHSRSAPAPRYDSDSDTDRRSRTSHRSRQSHRSRSPSDRSDDDAEESVNDRLKRLSLQINRDRARSHHNRDDDSEAELTIPASYRPSSKSGRPSSAAGSSSSRRSYRSAR